MDLIIVHASAILAETFARLPQRKEGWSSCKEEKKIGLNTKYTVWTISLCVHHSTGTCINRATSDVAVILLAIFHLR